MSAEGSDVSLEIKIIIPAYNEAQTVGNTIREFIAEIPSAQLVVIDNNSTDDTAKVAIEALGSHGIVLTESRQGKGNAVRKAFSEVSADIFVMVDADSTYSASDVHRLIEPIATQKIDMVVGDRISAGRYSSENKRPFHNLGNRVVILLINKVFGAELRDVMSGYRAFSKRFVATYPILVPGFELETDLTLHALDKRLRVLEVDISYKDRPQGSFSKLNTFKDGFRVLKVIFTIFRNYNPLKFFSLVAGILFSSSVLAAIPSFSDYIDHGSVEHLPTAVLAVGLTLSSMLALSVGLILDSISDQARRAFELELMKVS